jgi:RNA polymerase-binding protein DksA
VAKAASKKGSSGAKAARSTKPVVKSKTSKPAPKALAARGASKPAGKPASKPAPAPPAKGKPPQPARAEGRATAQAESQRRGAPVNNNGGAIAAPVPTNDKPRKNQAGLSARELEHFRDLLLAKRREILGDMSSMEREALRSSGGSNLSTLPIHMADMGTDNYEQEFTLGLVETERKLLREINNALAKIQNGTYGLCEGTSQAINKARLEVQPWARYGIEYAKKMERGGR